MIDALCILVFCHTSIYHKQLDFNLMCDFLGEQNDTEACSVICKVHPRGATGLGNGKINLKRGELESQRKFLPDSSLQTKRLGGFSAQKWPVYPFFANS